MRFQPGNKAAVGHGRKRKGKPLRIDEEGGGYADPMPVHEGELFTESTPRQNLYMSS